MIYQKLFFKYGINFNKFYNLILENNDNLIKVIPEIVFYEKGTWINNKRIDFIKINVSNIPPDLKYLFDLIKDNKGLISIKIKIDKNYIDDKIFIKTKFKLLGLIGSLINNTINLKANIIINNDDNCKTNINVNYEINSIFLHNKELNDKINIHIQKKLENYYIKNIDKYFSELI
jgi:hypothetical protein